MAFVVPVEKAAGSIQELDIQGAKIGGNEALPFLQFEGKVPNKPLVAVEVRDKTPDDWAPPLVEALSGVWDDPVKWAKFAQDEVKADLICLRFDSTHPDRGDTSVGEAVALTKKMLDEISVPLIFLGSNHPEKDLEVMKSVYDAAKGHSCIIGKAQEDNYKTFVAAAMANNHHLIALSDLDINLAKQLNILLTQMGFDKSRILMDTMSSALGYGLEYTYSVMERVTLAALRQGDEMMQMPIVNDIGPEAWKAKEAKTPTADEPQWGEANKRGILWESVTATAMMMAGSQLMILRHPESVKLVHRTIDTLGGN